MSTLHKDIFDLAKNEGSLSLTANSNWFFGHVADGNDGIVSGLLHRVPVSQDDYNLDHVEERYQIFTKGGDYATTYDAIKAIFDLYRDKLRGATLTNHAEVNCIAVSDPVCLRRNSESRLFEFSANIHVNARRS